MTTETEVTRFVPAKDVVTHFKTLKTASEEAGDYTFQRAGNGHFVCKHGEHAYAIIEKMSADGVPVIGCSCKAWTFAHDNDGCKHVAAFQKRSRRPAAALDKRIAMDLIGAGWIKTEHGNLYPPSEEKLTEDAAERQAEVDAAMDAKWNQEHPEAATSDPDGEDNEGSDPLPPEEDKPAPELGDKVWTRKCPHCDKVFDGTDLNEVKREHQDHIETCPQNPKNKDTTKPEPAPKVKLASRMITTKCQWCGEVLKHEDAAGLQMLIREHEAICPKRPEEHEQEATVAETATVEPQPEEEPKMEERTKRYSYAHPDGTAFETAEELLDYADKLKAEQEMSDTKALMTPQAPSPFVEQMWSDDQIEVMKKTVADKATPAEFAYFLNVVKYSGLNPFLREIYFMKTDKGQTAIIAGRDGYLTIAKRDPRFKGVHSMEVCANDEFEMSYSDGVMEVSKHKITDFKGRGEIIGAWARGQMNGQDPITVFVSIKEYDKGGNIWNRYKSAMIRKVAESMVLKRIAGISGLVTDAEVSESKDMILDAEVV